MTEAKKSKTTQLGFLAVSKTAPQRMATFPISPGFDATSAMGDLQNRLDGDGGWRGYALSIDSKGTLRIKAIKAARAKA